MTGYKRPSLTPRIGKRMRAMGIDTYPAYLDVLESQPGESGELFDSILINVTAFMRDREAWERLRADVLPRIVERSDRARQEIRIWSAGCATGQEPYTLAVLLADVVGEERFRTGVKIYATDADEDALRQARLARYPYGDLVEAFGEDRTERYFETARRGVHLPQRPPALGHLRPPRPRAGPADLPDRSDLVPHHADVLQRRDPAAGARQLPLRPRRRRLPVAGEGGGLRHPYAPVLHR